jgi:hypothetical protein
MIHFSWMQFFIWISFLMNPTVVLLSSSLRRTLQGSVRYSAIAEQLSSLILFNNNKPFIAFWVVSGKSPCGGLKGAFLCFHG